MYMSNHFFEDLRKQRRSIDLSTLLKAAKDSPVKPNREDIIRFIREHSYRFGILYLPDKIADLMAKIGKLFKPMSVIDINCGIGDLLSHCNYSDVKVGFDKNQDAIKLAAYLYPEIEFRKADILDVTPEEKFDVVISNLPFGQRIRRESKSIPIEQFLLEKALDLLNDEGVIICLVPVVLLTAQTYEKFRLHVLEKFALDMIVTLPLGIFKYSAVQGCILVIRKGRPQNTVYLAEYKKNTPQILENFQTRSGKFQVPLSRIQNRWDRHFFYPRYDEIDAYLKKESVRELGEISEIIRGYRFSKEQRLDKGEFLILNPRHFNKGKIEIDEKSKYTNSLDDPKFGKSILSEGDVAVSLIFDPSLYVYKKDDPPAIASDNIAIIRSRDNMYISTYLRTPEGSRLLLKQAERKTTRGIIHHLSIHDLGLIRIPILPLTDLNAVSDEEIAQALPKALTELKDELTPLLQEYQKPVYITREEFFELKGLIIDRFDRVEVELQSIKKGIDQILSLLKTIQKEILDIKKSHRDEEEKLIKINSRLDNLVSLITEQRRTISEYIEIVQRWIEHWDLLDEASRKFLSSAEFLFDEIFKMEDSDFSPFIIQYCRALENEILKKLFEAYHDDITIRIADIEELIKGDLANRATKEFAKRIQRNKREYTLGQMIWIMQLLKPKGRTLRGSKLLQDFRDFSLRYFKEKIVEKEYLDSIDEINEQFRRKAAHPNVLGLELAKKCQQLLRLTLKELLANYLVGK